MATDPGPWTPVNGFRTKLGKAIYDLSAVGRYKVALVTSASNISGASTAWSSVTGEVANGNGYTTGGMDATLVPSGTTVVNWPFSTTLVWLATGGAINGARTAVLRDTVTGDVLATCALDRTGGGSDVNAAVGENITVDSDGSPSNVFTFN